jgi:ornithine cyclodeaminase/alanine dehydrogenase-like protein (mu-crystallin family)
MKRPLFITELDCRAIMGKPGALADAIAEVEKVIVAAARGTVDSLARIHLAAPGAAATEMSGKCVRMLPAIGDTMGAAVRIYTMNKDGDPNRPAPCELILFFDSDDLTLRSVIEDYSLHSVRTAAPTAIATRHLARPGAALIGVIGTGRQAAAQIAAIASVQKLQEVRVFGRNRDRRIAFAAEMQRLVDCKVVPCESAKAAVKGAEIVTVAVNTRTPVLFGDWLEPGMHVNSISPCELDEQAVLRATIFPSSTDTLLYHQPRYSPFPEMVEGKRLPVSALTTELGQVAAGRAQGRRSDSDITLFVSTGSALWDLGVSRWIDGRAREFGLGKPLIDGDSSRTGTGFIVPSPDLSD